MIACKDGSKSFPRNRLNDGFCDCPDGTDEPGQFPLINIYLLITKRIYMMNELVNLLLDVWMMENYDDINLRVAVEM